MLFSSGIWYGKLIFLKLIFKENFIYLKNVIGLYIYSGTPLARPPTGRRSIGCVNGTGVVASHLYSSRFPVLSRSLHFCNYFLDWKLYRFVLRAVIAYNLKSHNRKRRCRSTNSRRVSSMSLLRHIGTNCACTHAYIPASKMLQDNVMLLSNLLLTGYQFSQVTKSLQNEMETWNQWVSFILWRPYELTIRFLIKIFLFQ